MITANSWVVFLRSNTMWFLFPLQPLGGCYSFWLPFILYTVGQLVYNLRLETKSGKGALDTHPPTKEAAGGYSFFQEPIRYQILVTKKEHAKFKWTEKEGRSFLGNRRYVWHIQ